MLDNALYQRLATSAVGPLLGGTSTTGGFSTGFSAGFDLGIVTGGTPRIYPDEPMENTPIPFLVYSTTGADPVTTLAGDLGITFYDTQIDVVAEKKSTAQAIADAVRSALQMYAVSPFRLIKMTGVTSQPITAEGKLLGHQYSLTFRVII